MPWLFTLCRPDDVTDDLLNERLNFSTLSLKRAFKKPGDPVGRRKQQDPNNTT